MSRRGFPLSPDSPLGVPGHRAFLALVGQSLILTSGAAEAGTPSLAAHAIIQRLGKKEKKEKEKKRPFVRCALRTVITLARVHAQRADQ